MILIEVSELLVKLFLDGWLILSPDILFSYLNLLLQNFLGLNDSIDVISQHNCS